MGQVFLLGMLSYGACHLMGHDILGHVVSWGMSSQEAYGLWGMSSYGACRLMRQFANYPSFLVVEVLRRVGGGQVVYTE